MRKLFETIHKIYHDSPEDEKEFRERLIAFHHHLRNETIRFERIQWKSLCDYIGFDIKRLNDGEHKWIYDMMNTYNDGVNGQFEDIFTKDLA